MIRTWISAKGRRAHLANDGYRITFCGRDIPSSWSHAPGTRMPWCSHCRRAFIQGVLPDILDEQAAR